MIKLMLTWLLADTFFKKELIMERDRARMRATVQSRHEKMRPRTPIVAVERGLQGVHVCVLSSGTAGEMIMNVLNSPEIRECEQPYF